MFMMMMLMMVITSGCLLMKNTGKQAKT